jgi:hypothetical protein
MKYILYQLDDDFNMINKFKFGSVIVAFEYINKHLAEEPNANLLEIHLDDNGDIRLAKTYRKGKYHKTLA